MDRRTLLAFALIFIILIGYPKFMSTFFGDQTPSTAPDSTSVAITPETTDSGLINPERSAVDEGGVARDNVISQPTPREYGDQGGIDDGGAVLPAQALTFRDQPGIETQVSVETADYIVVISSVGARITNWQGKDYLYHEGGPVELIPQGQQAAAVGYDMVSFTGFEVELGPINFQPDTTGDVVLNTESGEFDLTFVASTHGGLEIQKRYTFYPDRFDIDVELAVVAGDAALASNTLQMMGNPSTFFFGWNQGIASTERNKRMETPAFRSFARVGEDLHFKKRGGLSKSVEKVQGYYKGSLYFAGVQNKYFHIAGIIPQEPDVPSPGEILLGGDQATGQQSWGIALPAHRNNSRENVVASRRIHLLIGPSEKELLTSLGVGLDLTMDLGWKLFRPLSEAVLWIMDQMHRVISNYGVIIILFSILTKVMFWPLTRKSTESMRRMQALQPKLKALQEKYKDNKEKLAQAQMEMYKKEKVNPMAGCLPLLVQSPVFIALYQGLNHTIALRNTPFVLWIKDLSQPDAMFQLPFSLPMLGSDFNLLPILMSVAMYFQTKLTPTASAGGQMAVMNTMMPLLMLFFFYNMPSGLVLYWLVNTILQIQQTWKIQKTAPATGGNQES